MSLKVRLRVNFDSRDVVCAQNTGARVAFVLFACALRLHSNNCLDQKTNLKIVALSFGEKYI